MKKLLLAVMILAPTLALANPGSYIQGQLGAGGPLPGAAWGFDGGYLWGDDNLNYGLEAGLTGNSGGFFDNTNGFGINLLSVLKYTFDCGFVTFAKAGITYLNETETTNSLFGSYSSTTTSSAIGPQVGLGIGYQFNPHWEFDLTADAAYLIPTQRNYSINGDDFTQNNFYNGDLVLGLTYHFA